jgi:hypothetical protein
MTNDNSHKIFIISLCSKFPRKYSAGIPRNSGTFTKYTNITQLPYNFLGNKTLLLISDYKRSIPFWKYIHIDSNQ